MLLNLNFNEDPITKSWLILAFIENFSLKKCSAPNYSYTGKMMLFSFNYDFYLLIASNKFFLDN